MNDRDKKGVVLLSGGMDSTTLLYRLHAMGRVAGVISFDYGQRHKKELEFAKWHVEKLGISNYWVVSLDRLQGKSALVDPTVAVPHGHYEDQSMRSTVVPFRNGVMLAFGVNYAEALGADLVYYAAHAGDHAIYPDCRPDFFTAFNQAARAGTYNGVQVVAPFGQISKREIAKIGYKLGVDWTKTWSCYEGGDIHCGKCGTCVERKEALGDRDPTEYEE